MNENKANIILRPIIPYDWTAILQIQELAYTKIAPETIETLQSKEKISPNTCWVIELEGNVAGYLLAHPWSSRKPLPLDFEIKSIPHNADTLYIHDLALHPDVQQSGIGSKCIDFALQEAQKQGFKKTALISVQDSSSFWEKAGYQIVSNLSLSSQESFQAYGSDAVYMEKDILFSTVFSKKQI